MKKSIVSLLVGLLALVTLGDTSLAQQDVRRGGQNPKTSEAYSGVRVVIAVWDEKDRDVAQKLAETLKPVLDAIASGAKITKADAAPSGRPAEELQKLQDWLTNAISKSRQERKLAISEVRPAGSGSPSYKKNVKCPTCGSDKHEYCFPLLDYPKTVLEDYPIDDPELSCIRLSNGTCYPQDCCGNTGGAGGRIAGPGRGQLTEPQPTVVVFILAGTARNYRQEKQALVELVTQSVEEALRSASNLVIKIKSGTSLSLPGDQVRIVVLHDPQETKDEVVQAFTEAAKKLPERFWTNPDSVTLEEFSMILSPTKRSADPGQAMALREAFRKYGPVLVFNAKQKQGGEEGGCPKPIEPHCFEFVRPPLLPICMCLLDLGRPESGKSQKKRQIIISFSETPDTYSALRNVLDNESLIGKELAKRPGRVIVVRYLPLGVNTYATEEELKKALAPHYPRFFGGPPTQNREVFMYCYRRGKDGRCREWYICEIENNVAKRCFFVIDDQIYSAIYVFG